MYLKTSNVPIREFYINQTNIQTSKCGTIHIKKTYLSNSDLVALIHWPRSKLAHNLPQKPFLISFVRRVTKAFITPKTPHQRTSPKKDLVLSRISRIYWSSNLFLLVHYSSVEWHHWLTVFWCWDGRITVTSAEKSYLEVAGYILNSSLNLVFVLCGFELDYLHP